MIKHIPQIAAFALLPATQIHAALLAYEPFDYASIGNGTAVTGDGFAGNWNIGQGGLSVTTNLTYPGLPTEASAAKSLNATRALATLDSPVTSGVVYATLLLQGGGNSGADKVGFMLTGTTSSLFVGFGDGFSGSDTWFGMGEIGGGNTWGNPTSFTNGVAASNTAVHFVLLEVNLTTNAINLWLDPTAANVAAGTPGSATQSINVALGNITGFGINAIGGALPTIDEVRVGDTMAAVAGIPEPGAAALLGVAGLTLLLRRRKA
jgi:hypothetical protein